MPNRLFSSTSISASGMAAERQRMELVANNIANANSTRTADGQPYRRKQLIFSAAVDSARSPFDDTNPLGLLGVEVTGVSTDNTPFDMVEIPGHPHADANGMVALPNVSLPTEMVDLISASRSYEANLRALTLFREMMEQTLSLLAGGRR